MPVLGHAFVGWATALSTSPPRLPLRSPQRAAIVGAFWVPLLIGLAYVPDITRQGLDLLSVRGSGIATHSLLFALLASASLGLAVTWATSLDPRASIALTFVSITIHDLLDIAQATDRQLFWPWSTWQVTLGLPEIFTTPSAELVGYGSLFGIFLLGRAALGRSRKTSGTQGRSIAPQAASATVTWTAWAIIVVIMLAAGGTHYLRDRRERQLELARTLAEAGDYRAVFDALDGSDRWPAVAKPGRSAYIRGLAYEGLGDRKGAEHWLVEAHRSDPAYFWALADLAALYASGDEPSADRRRRVAPYLHQLETDFSTHPALSLTLEHVEGMLHTRR
jgi:membrane-bound metal-dependent hydrolase YbcI (DUF457 family)